MRLGATLPLALGGSTPGPGSLADSARALERLGYRSVWVFDAVGRGFMLPDPLMALTVAATATTELELGTGVFQLPIRSMPEVAHRALTLRLIAGDRFLFGVGPGSTDADFEAFGGDYAQRFVRFDQQLAELARWFDGGGEDEVSLSPWPSVLGGPPVLLAGWRGAWIERAASSSGWIASAAYANDAQLADGLGRFRNAGGRRAIVTNVQVGPDIGPAVARIGRLAAMGFDDAILFDLTPTEERLAAVIAAC